MNAPRPNARPRLLVLIKGLGAGGAERLLLLQLPLLLERHEVEVCYVMADRTHLRDAVEATGAQVTHLCASDSRWAQRTGLAWLLPLRRRIRETRPDVVHAHSPLPAIAARLLRRAGQVPLPAMVYTEHSPWGHHNAITRWLNRLTIGGDDHVFCVSESVRDSMVRFRPDVELVVHGIDVERVRADIVHRDAVRAEWGVDDEDVVVGMFANFRPEKNHKLVMDVAARLLPRYPRLHFVLHGQGKLEAELRARLATLSLPARFRFAGYTPTPTRQMAGLDILILPSSFEGLPVVLMEAVCQRLPVIATRLDGIAGMFDGDRALLIERNSPDALERSLETLIDPLDGPARRARMAERLVGSEHDFSLTRYVRRAEEVYASVRGASPPPPR